MYTSGRTVKSRANTAPTTKVTATREVRRLVAAHVPTCSVITINSTLAVDPRSLDLQVRTVVTFPAGTDVAALVEVLKTFDDLVTLNVSAYDITLIRRTA